MKVIQVTAGVAALLSVVQAGGYDVAVNRAPPRSKTPASATTTVQQQAAEIEVVDDPRFSHHNLPETEEDVTATEPLFSVKSSPAVETAPVMAAPVSQVNYYNQAYFGRQPANPYISAYYGWPSYGGYFQPEPINNNWVPPTQIR